MIDARVEEVLEELYVAEVEQGRTVSAEGADQALLAAEGLGYVARSNGLCRLTPAGKVIAADVVRRHRLAECLLKYVLAVNADDIDADACQFEHILRPGLEEKICALLGHPTACPHGKPIPAGECCRSAGRSGVREVTPLSQGKLDAEGVVAYLGTRDQSEVRKLMAMGVLPGSRIRLLRRSPCFVFEIGLSQFTVDQSLAEKVFVHWRELPLKHPAPHPERRHRRIRFGRRAR